MTQNAPSSDQSTVEQVKEGTKRVTSTARERVGRVGDEAKTQAKRLGDEARAVARERLEDQGTQVSAAAGRMSEDLRTMAGSIDTGLFADLATRASETIDEFTRRFDEGGIDGIGRDITDFARRRPALFLGGTFVLGLAAGRLFRNTEWPEVTGDNAPQPSETT